MKKQIIITLLIVAVIAAGIGLYAQKGPPWPLPPNAATVVCGEVVVTPGEMPLAVEQLRDLGCTHTETDYIYDGYYLLRGTKIVITN